VLQSEMESSKPWPWTQGALRTTRHVLGHGLGSQVLGLTGKQTLGLDPFSLVCLVFYVDWISIMNVGRYGYHRQQICIS